MTTLTPDTIQTLLDHLRPDLLDPPTFAPTSTGKFNHAYFVQADEEALVLRVAPPPTAVYVFYEREMMRQEPALHRQVRAETTVPVPEILTFDESHTLIDRDFMLMERRPGRPLSHMGHVSFNKVLGQLGDMLAAVHQLTATQYGYLGAHRPMTPQPTWNDAFSLMWQKLIQDVIDVGHYDEGEADFLRRLLATNLHLFDRNVPASLLHMDIWQQNILVDDRGVVTAVLDWDRALWGDPEIEYAVLDYCGIAEPAFWEGYGQPRDTSPAAQIRQRFYLLYELQKYIVINHGRRHDPLTAARYKQQVLTLAHHDLPAPR